MLPNPVRHARFDDADAAIRDLRQRVRRRAASQEVGDHLGGNRLWPDGHAFHDNAVITGADVEPGRVGGRGVRTLYARELHRERFEAPQASGWLGLAVDGSLRTIPGVPVERGNLEGVAQEVIPAVRAAEIAP